MYYVSLTPVKPDSLSQRSLFVPVSTILRHDRICRWARRSIGDETRRGQPGDESEYSLLTNVKEYPLTYMYNLCIL